MLVTDRGFPRADERDGAVPPPIVEPRQRTLDIDTTNRVRAHGRSPRTAPTR